jgi:hypothetical protein
MIKAMPNLEELNFSKNRFTISGAKTIAQAAALHPKLKMLDFYPNDFKESERNELKTIFDNTKVVYGKAPKLSPSVKA